MTTHYEQLSKFYLGKKYRRKCINEPMLKRLGEIFAATLAKWDGELIEFNSEADHVHLLMSVNPKAQPSKLVNNLKTLSSRLIRKELKEHLSMIYWSKPVFWNRSYYIISCGGTPISALKQYIRSSALLSGPLIIKQSLNTARSRPVKRSPGTGEWCGGVQSSWRSEVGPEPRQDGLP